MSQTTYTLEADKAFQGMLADAPNEPDILSRALEGADAAYGVGLLFGTDPVTQVQGFNSTGAALAGVAAHEHREDNRSLLLDLSIVAGNTVNVVRKGRLWVPVETTITPITDGVFCRHTANGGLDLLGAWRNDADTANADDFSAVGQWQDYFAVAGLPHNLVGLALLDLNLP